MEWVMVRHPLFRDEENTHQLARFAQNGIQQPAASDMEMHSKATADDALWNRMNLAMRLSCRPPELPPKR